MSDLIASQRLRPNASQLPVSWYFDPHVFELEQELLFAEGPRYVGHELMVPEQGDYYVLPWMDDARMLVRNASGVELLWNVCRHRQSLMLRGRGNVEAIVCPVHRWTYDLQGRLLGAPHFPDNPCLNLRSTPLQSWHGLLFAGRRDVATDLAGCSVARDLDFTGYRLDRVEVAELEQNWKTFVEVYLEDYHVVPFHPGLGNFVTCEDLRWEIADAYSVQVVGVKDGFKRAGSELYARYQNALTRYMAGSAPRQGAIWFLYYPNVTIEWYPCSLVISTVIPRSPTHTTNVIEFYYPEEVALFERELVEAQQAAYLETAREDDDIARRIDGGRRALWREGANDAGPYQSPMEDGMMHFHEYLRRKLSPRL